MTEKRETELYDELCKLTGEKVMQLMTDWLGMQIFTDEFEKFLVDEGVVEEKEDAG